MNIFNHPNGQSSQQQVPQLDNRAAAQPPAHVLLRLKMGQQPQAFDYRASIRQLGELLKKYTPEVCNDNISVQLRDWGFKITTLDLRDASKVKNTIIEQLDLLAKRILVNEIDFSPLREPVFLGESMGKVAEFVGEREMLEEYLLWKGISTQSLKVHDFASAVLELIKPVAEWVKQSELNPSTDLVAYQGPIANPEEIVPTGPVRSNLIDSLMVPQAPLPGALNPGFNPMFFSTFGVTLTPEMEAYVQNVLKQKKMESYEGVISGGLFKQFMKRQAIEHRNGAQLAEQQRELATVALEANLGQLVNQLDTHEKDYRAAIDQIKSYHDEQIVVLNGENEDLLKKQEDTHERLVVQEKRSDQLQGQVSNLSASLQSAWARVRELEGQGGGGFCVVQ